VASSISADTGCDVRFIAADLSQVEDCCAVVAAAAQLNIGWMASDGEDRIQRQYHGASPNWLEEAAAQQPFGRLLAPEEVARAVAFLVSADSGLMTGSVINFDQSVWGAYPFSPPTPTSKMELPRS
jgi:enoyl-[acyl-carrier-protein] reductase (NADH)